MATLTENRRRSPLLWIVPMLVLVLGGTAWFVWGRSQDEGESAAGKVPTAPVQTRDITVKIAGAGTIKPLTPVNISPKQSGRLIALYVEQGQRVQAGQLLARMDDSNLRGQLLTAQGNLAAAEANLKKLQAGNRPQEIGQAQASLRQAQADLLAARSTYESNAALFASGAISRNALDVSRSQYESIQARIAAQTQVLNLQRAGFRREDVEAARAQVVVARGQLATIQAQVNDTSIRAPFAGIVTQKYANPGAFVTPTTTASTTNSATSSSVLALAGELEAVVNVAEADIRNVYPGQTVDLQADAYPGRSFRGKVRLVAPEAVVTQNVTSFEVRIRLIDDQKHLLRSGMNLHADFIVGVHRDALLVPTVAILSRERGTIVFVEEGGKPRPRPIEVGATVGTETEVLDGLDGDERVYLSFPGRRKPNDRPVRGGGSPFGSGRPGGGPGGRPPR